jgi:hypothetical protein
MPLHFLEIQLTLLYFLEDSFIIAIQVSKGPRIGPGPHVDLLKKPTKIWHFSD